MEHEIIPGEQSPDDVVAPAGQEKRSQVITWFIGLTLLWLVGSYSALGALSAKYPPQQGAYDIVVACQAGLKDFILMALGGFLGAITQKHA